MSGQRTLNSKGDSIVTQKAKESGRYINAAGVPIHVNQGDPIPTGAVPEDQYEGTPANDVVDLGEIDEKPAAKSRRKPAANKAKDSAAESK
jgi:hypothetical protein